MKKYIRKKLNFHIKRSDMKNFYKTILLIISTAISMSVNAQTTFQRSFGGSGNGTGTCIRELLGGGYIIVGGTDSYGSGSNDVYLINMDASGNIVWTKTYGGTGSESATDIRQTADGGFIIIGTSGTYPALDLYLVKVDISGTLQWAKTIDRASSSDQGYAVVQTSDGGFVAAGKTRMTGFDDDYYLVKTDSTGTILWSNTYGKGTGSDNIEAMEQTSDGGFVLVGTTFNSFAGTSFGAYVVKTNSLGITQWANAYSTPATGGGTNECRAVTITTDGNILVSTETDNAQPGSSVDCMVFKLDNNGNLLWTGNPYGWPSPSMETAWDIAKTSDGGSIEAGLGGGTFINGDVFLIKRDNAGLMQWSKTYGSTDNDVASSVSQTSDGGYIVLGYTESFGATNRDIYVIKTDANGNSGCFDLSVTPPGAVATVTSDAGFTSTTGGISSNTTPIILTPPFPGTDTVLCSVISALPIAAFNTSATNFCVGTCINFTDITSGAPTAWSWTFPGSATTSSTSQNPVGICYNTPGTYIVTLQATNSAGNDTATQTIVLNPVPVLSISPASGTICSGETISLSASGASSYNWLPASSLSNAGISNPIASPTITTTYTLVGTSFGCADTSFVTITVNPSPSITVNSKGSKQDFSRSQTTFEIQFKAYY